MMELEAIIWKGMDWIDIAQDKGQWREHLKTIMNIRIT
jgi:hypothetical protein